MKTSAHNTQFSYYAAFPKTITPEMVRRVDAYTPSHATCKGMVELMDRTIWSRIQAFEDSFRRSNDGRLSARLFLMHAFTHEVRALILTAVVRLGLDHTDQATHGCRCFSPAQRLSSMYKAQRIAEPDVPVKEILQNIVESLHV